ncbi:hypothetical protein DL93DRAFT_2092149 [Clavulina sp. PMI_390]|nr:hypothetical protein DL93DRAFT_2092149 [Clavulina sp. PMI_390]
MPRYAKSERVKRRAVITESERILNCARDHYLELLRLWVDGKGKKPSFRAVSASFGVTRQTKQLSSSILPLKCHFEVFRSQSRVLRNMLWRLPAQKTLPFSNSESIGPPDFLTNMAAESQKSGVYRLNLFEQGVQIQLPSRISMISLRKLSASMRSSLKTYMLLMRAVSPLRVHGKCEW